jgi:hypothetical protein
MRVVAVVSQAICLICSGNIIILAFLLAAVVNSRNCCSLEFENYIPALCVFSYSFMLFMFNQKEAGTAWLHQLFKCISKISKFFQHIKVTVHVADISAR